MIISRFIHVAANDNMPYFLWLRGIPYIYTPHHFIYSAVNGYLDCFHVLAIVNSAAMNIGVHVSILEFCSAVCLGVGLLDHMVILLLVF